MSGKKNAKWQTIQYSISKHSLKATFAMWKTNVSKIMQKNRNMHEQRRM